VCTISKENRATFGGGLGGLLHWPPEKKTSRVGTNAHAGRPIPPLRQTWGQ